MIKTLSLQVKPKVRQVREVLVHELRSRGHRPFPPLYSLSVWSQVDCTESWGHVRPDNIREKNETTAFGMSFPEDALAYPVTHSETTHGPVVEYMLRSQLSYLLKG